MAMNGTSYGMAITGNPSRSAVSTTAFGTFACEKPSPNPSPASPASPRRAT